MKIVAINGSPRKNGNTARCLEAVGREVGIPEPGYFSRVFKKVEGVAPGEYRRMW